MDKTDAQVRQLTAATNSCSIDKGDISMNNISSAKQGHDSDTLLKTVSINKCDHTVRSSRNNKISPSSGLNTRRKNNSKVSKTYLKASTFKYRYKTFKSHVDDGLATRMGSMSLKQSEMVRLCGDTVASSCDLLQPVSERSLTPKTKQTEHSVDCNKRPSASRAQQLLSSKTKNCCDCPQSSKALEGDNDVLHVKITSHRTTESTPSALSSTTTTATTPAPQKKNCKLKMKKTCSAQARSEWDFAADDLASYMTDCWVLPKEMSTMAEMMYT